MLLDDRPPPRPRHDDACNPLHIPGVSIGDILVADIAMDGNEAISGEMSQAAAAAKKRTRASIACNHCRAKRSKVCMFEDLLQVTSSAFARVTNPVEKVRRGHCWHAVFAVQQRQPPVRAPARWEETKVCFTPSN